MTLLEVYGIIGVIVLGLMIVLWIVSLIVRDSSIIDPLWGTGFVIINWVAFALTPEGYPARKWLLSILVTLWGLRLSLYLLWRNWGKGEDFRYRKWRDDHGAKWWWRSFFQVFFLQGILMWIISAPLVATQMGSEPSRLIWLDGIGVVVWLIGFFFEAVGDFQMARFKADPANKGQVLRTGVWRYTRHPNYFGDAAQWWGYYLITAAAGAIWTIFSPILMTILLVRVSGVTLLERTLKDTKPGYKEYVETTNSFIPWLPKKSSSMD